MYITIAEINAPVLVSFDSGGISEEDGMNEKLGYLVSMNFNMKHQSSTSNGDRLFENYHMRKKYEYYTYLITQSFDGSLR